MENKKAFINKFHETMVSYYKEVDVKNPEVFKHMTIDVDIIDKYEEADEDTRSCIWEYIGSLCSYSKLYHVYNDIIPSGMADGISEMAQKLATGMEEGKSLMDMDIMKMGQQIAETMDKEDLENLSKNLMSNIGSLTSMIPDQATGGTSPELTSMMGSLMTMLPKPPVTTELSASLERSRNR